MSFGEEIRNMRYALLLSQDKFAKQLGVVAYTVNSWENGRSLPGTNSMASLQQFFEKNGIETDTILRIWKEEIEKRN